jgi:hypothetical protein
MTIADFYPNLRHRGVVILLKVNDCYGPGIGKTNHRSDASMKYLESAQEVDSEVFMKASVNVGVLAQTDAP